MKHHLLLFSLLLAAALTGKAQIDSTFQSEVFGVDDLAPLDGFGQQKVSSANRILANADELPLRTIVVTREEIQANGYVTLVDVLKTLPGFRTSQPGSGMMGETFLMRGLIGNLYTKILINGVPVTPSGALGMPIGGQLPVQSAERIEIVLGAAAAVYGTDAMAGVINIVLGDVERPVEARGGAALGTRGSEFLHLSLGGKLGRDKNIVDYNFYASSYSVSDLAVRFEGSYPELTVERLENLPEGLWLTEDGDSLKPEIEEIPHQSRLIGLNVGFRGLSYNFNYLRRQDHSSLGSHFREFAYYNPNNYHAETIQSHALRYQNSFGKWEISGSLSALLYEMDKNSSYYGVDHPISSYNNFMYASSNDYSAELYASYQASKRWNILAGGNLTLSEGIPFQGYLNDPFDMDRSLLPGPGDTTFVRNASDSISAIDRVSIFNLYQAENIGLFAQAYYQTDRWKVIAGARYDKIFVFDARLSPQVSFFYQLNKRWRFRGMAAQAFRAPNYFFVYNNYEGRNPPMNSQEVVLTRTRVELSPESMQTIEGGVDYQMTPELSLGAHAFLHARRNSIFPEINLPTNNGGNMGDASEFEVNYFNATSYSQLTGLQLFANYDDGDLLRVEAFGQANLGFERIDSVIDLDSTYSNVSRFMAGVNVHLKLPKKIYVSVFGKVFSSYPWAVQTVDGIVRAKESDGFYNIDITAGKSLSDRLRVYVRLTNATRSVNHGIYTNTISGFRYNYLPQPGRHITGGLSFDLNRKE